jgi:outer membrane protein assembly factor BamB
MPARALTLALVFLAGQWPQWGGPSRNFMVESKGLATAWPASGPKRLWTRTLGEGHSSITVDGSRLYTMYRPVGVMSYVRRSQEEVVTALNAATGTTVWEYRYPAPTGDMDFSQGAGPHSTPLVTADRVFAASSRKQLFALDKTTGRLVWSHDMIKEYGATSPGRGYSCSPLLYNGMILMTVGGSGPGSRGLRSAHRRTGVEGRHLRDGSRLTHR